MKPFTVVLDANRLELALLLVGELRARRIDCIAVVEPAAASAAPVSACAALAAAGISTVFVGGSPSLLENLPATSARVLAARESPAATIADLRARGWVPAEGEAYTDEEMEAVTARLRDLGYA